MNLDFSNINVLLIGDFMIDHYIIGSSSRMSPEAPVPVVLFDNEYSIAGGAGNVAMNLSAMGSNVTCVGYVGNDIWGEKLISILQSEDINTENISVIENHPTTLKQRTYANGKQIARIDIEKIIDWHPNSTIKEYYSNYDIVIFSDYNKGAINNRWFDFMEHSNIIVDPKKDNFNHYRGANIITPNLNELKRASSIEITDDDSIITACNKLIDNSGFKYIVAKKGDQGMTIVGQNNFVKHIKAHSVDSPDVTGAGDTVISALSLAYAQTNDIEISAKIANLAAAIVVAKTGTEIVTVDELKNKINNLI